MKRKLWTWKDISQLQKFYPEKEIPSWKENSQNGKKKILTFNKKEILKRNKSLKRKNNRR